MQQEQYLRLKEAAKDHAFTSIAVNSDGMPVTSGSVPWERSVSAFNMRAPKITLSAEDLADDEAGRLPKGLKRGVLSEDGIYNLLERYRELGS